MIYRPLVLECVDPGFLRSVSRAGAPAHIAFLALVVMNLVGGFHALGTLLAVGIMMLPAVIARFWARDITTMILIAVVSGAISGYAGLLVSFHTGAPSGPAIILVAGVLYAVSVLFGRVGGLSASCSPAAISKPEAAMLRHVAFAALALLLSPRARRRAGEAEGRRDLLDPRGLREECRRRSRGGHGAGRPERRRACLSAVAGRREDARRRQGRVRQRARLRRLDQSPGEGVRHQGADGRRHQGHQAAQGRGRSRPRRRRSARLAVGRECEALRGEYPRRAGRRRSGRQGHLRGERRGLSRPSSTRSTPR